MQYLGASSLKCVLICVYLQIWDHPAVLVLVRKIIVSQGHCFTYLAYFIAQLKVINNIYH